MSTRQKIEWIVSLVAFAAAIAFNLHARRELRQAQAYARSIG